MEKSSGSLSVLSCNVNTIATALLFLKFSEGNFLDKLMKVNGFLVYFHGNWHTLKQAINITLQSEIIQKVNVLCSVPGKLLQDFLICQIMPLSCYHVWQPAHLDGKSIYLLPTK